MLYHAGMKVLILCDIRSTHNVGAILRTADAVGIEKVYLVGVTPSPIDRFGRPVKAIAKTALGAEKSLVWEHVPDILSLINILKEQHFSIVAIEQDKKAKDYKSYKPKEKTAILLGPEVEGLSPEVLDACDAILEIPMRGKKESLNVSVAAGIVLYRLMDL